jgi:hypothetical protein
MGEREPVTPRAGDSRDVRRKGQGRFAEQDDIGRSLKQDRPAGAEAVAKPRQGDHGDQKPR